MPLASIPPVHSHFRCPVVQNLGLKFLFLSLSSSYSTALSGTTLTVFLTLISYHLSTFTTSTIVVNDSAFLSLLFAVSLQTEHWPPFPPSWSLPATTQRRNDSWWQSQPLTAEIMTLLLIMVLCVFCFHSQVTSVISQTGLHLGSWPKR